MSLWSNTVSTVPKRGRRRTKAQRTPAGMALEMEERLKLRSVCDWLRKAAKVKTGKSHPDVVTHTHCALPPKAE